MKNEPQDERLLRDSPRSEIMTLPWFINFYLKVRFLSSSGAFNDFRTFFHGNVRLSDLIQFSEIKEKSIFSAPEGGKWP